METKDNIWWKLVFDSDTATWVGRAMCIGFIIGLFQDWSHAILYGFLAPFALLPLLALFGVFGLITDLVQMFREMKTDIKEMLRH